MLKALAHLEKGDVLLVAKYDRIARDLLLQLTVERTVTQKGAQIISCSAPGSSGTSASDVLLRNLLASVAQYERAIIGQRISQAHQARLTVDLNNKLVPEKTEQIVCSAVKRMRECGYSWKKAAEALNQRHYYNRSDRPWSLHNLRAIFVKREGYEKVKRDDKWLSIWEKYIYLPVWWYPARETQVNEAF